MNMLKLLTVGFFSLLLSTSFAQLSFQPTKLSERIYVGGGGGLGGGRDVFGNRFTRITVTPMIGYLITDQFSAGTSLSYININYSDLGFRYKQYGVMPFLRYNINDLFLMTEFNLINVPSLNFNGQYDISERLTVTRLLAGAGYSMPVGGRSRVNAVGMYDLAYKRQYFSSPWVLRVFFTI